MGFLDRFRAWRVTDMPEEPAPPPPPVRRVYAGLREEALAGAGLPRLRELMEAGLREHGMSPDGVRRAMELVGDGVGLLELGDASRRSRIGGDPVLPAGAGWPRDRDGAPLRFIAKLDLDDLPALEPLPPSGVLSVFWAEQFHEWDRMDFKVATRVHWIERGAEAVTPETPAGAERMDAVPLTGVYLPILGEIERIDLEHDGDVEALDAADEDLHEHGYEHQLLGRSRDIQGPVLAEIDYWFEQGYPQSREG